MTDRPGLSKGELEVARVLWGMPEGTVRQVHEAFPRERKIDFATVQTYLRRLEAKGYVQTRLEGRILVYSTRVKPKTVIRRTVDELVDRLFGGETLPLVQHLIEERGLSGQDVRQLRELLNRLERKQGRDT